MEKYKFDNAAVQSKNMPKNLLFAMRRHKIVTGIIIIALGAGGYFIFGTGKNTSTETTYTYGTAATGTIMQTVSGTGQIEAFKQTDITAKVSGQVTRVAVTEGQRIESGDLIATVDDRDGRDAVEDAEIALYNAQVSLDDLAEPADSLDLAKAKNSVTQAQKTVESDKTDLEESYEKGFSEVASAFNNLPTIIAGLQEITTTANNYVVQSSPTYLDYYYNSVKNYDSVAATLLAKATASYQEARVQYDTNFQDYKSASRFSSEEDIEALIDETYQTTRTLADALKNVSNVIQNYEDNLKNHGIDPQGFAQTQLDSLSGYMLTNSADLNSLLAARQAIDTAKDAIDTDTLSLEEYRQALADLEKGSDETDIQSAEYAVQQKKRALTDAKEELGDYTITAPFAGTVASADIEPGDDISSGAAIATMITNNQIVTVSLNEVDIAKVKAGQQATLTFDAIENLTMTGKVAEVATVGTVSSGVVNYDVTITLDSENSQVKVGMSTSVTIVADIAQDVLTVPAAAVKAADDGTYYVLVPAAAPSVRDDAVAQVTKQTVTVGLDDGTSIEIKGGLKEGDQVVISSTKSMAPTKSSSSSGSIFNMGGGGPRN